MMSSLVTRPFKVSTLRADGHISGRHERPNCAEKKLYEEVKTILRPPRADAQ